MPQPGRVLAGCADGALRMSHTSGKATEPVCVRTAAHAHGVSALTGLGEHAGAQHALAAGKDCQASIWQVEQDELRPLIRCCSATEHSARCTFPPCLCNSRSIAFAPARHRWLCVALLSPRNLLPEVLTHVLLAPLPVQA